VAYTGDQLVAETFQSPEGDPADDSVGSKNILGYNRVVALADCLVTLKASNKRCFLGQNSGPASWPDCNRYRHGGCNYQVVPNLPFTVKTIGNSTLPWTLVGNAYKKIREAVVNNAHVMQQTGIQLTEINQRTLIQWQVS